MAQGKVYVGIGGWTYAPWRGVFYPERLPHARELAYAAERFSSIEINGTFYSLQRPSSFARWAAATPDDFVFSVKASRFITHMLRLRNVEQALANFFASGLLLLGPKLGPILWQFPPNFSFDASLLEDFFQLLPRNTMEAAQVARRHDSRLRAALIRRRTKIALCATPSKFATTASSPRTSSVCCAVTASHLSAPIR